MDTAPVTQRARWRQPPGLRRVAPYAAAVVLSAITALARFGLAPVLGADAALLIFIVPIFISAWLGGAGPGLLATLTSLLLGAYLFLVPYGSFIPSTSPDLVRSGIFVIEGILISLMSERLLRSQQQLRAGNERFRLLVEGVQDYAILMLDPAGCVASWNGGAERILGYPAGPILGQHVARFFPNDGERHAVRQLDVAAAVGRATHEGWMVRQDGEHFWASVAITAIHDPHGTMTGYAMVTHDLTERKQAEAAVSRHQAQLAGIIDAAMDAIITTDAAQRVVQWNAAAERMFGCSAADVIGGPLDRFIPARSRERHREHVAGFGATGETSRHMGNLGPLTALRTDGSEFPIEAAISHLTIDGDLFYTVILRDITQRVQAERAARASEERFAKAFHASPAATIISTAADGRFLDVNERFVQVFGRAREDVVGRTAFELGVWGEDERGTFLTRLRAETRVRDLEMRVAGAGGEPHDVLISAELMDLDGVPCMMTAIYDVTRRKRAEADLHYLTRNARCLLWQGTVVDEGPQYPALTWRTTISDEEAGQSFTPLAMLPGELYLQAWYRLRHPDDRAEVDALATAAIRASQSSYTTTFRCQMVDGSYRWFEEQVNVVPSAPMHWQVIGVAFDVTERKRLEERYLQAQKMESVGQLAGGIAHDFNNLLTVFQGHVEMAMDDVPRDTAAHDHLDQSLRAVRRAANLTRQILAFARRQSLHPTLITLNDLTRDMERMLRRLITEDVGLSLALAPDLGVTRADAGQIEQVLVNLVVNARDAMPGGGQITIATGNAVLTPPFGEGALDLAPGAYVTLAVSDTGCGIAPGLQQHVFEPFFTTKAPGQGSGLGLATCYGIAKQHGGAIRLISEEGRGTTVTVYLPRVEPAEAPEDTAAPASERTPPRGRETVLVVEDEAQVRAIAVRQLRSWGYTVLEAEHGEEALRIARAAAPGSIDLLLTDVVMPVLSGPAAAQVIRGIHPAIAVVFMSGYTRDVRQPDVDLLPDVPLLEKPFSGVALAAAVRSALEAGHRSSGDTRRALQRAG